MKRRESRVLTFAVTGALLGGAGTGCHHHYRGPYVNPGPDERPPASPEDPEPDEAAPDPAPEPDAPEPDDVDDPPADPTPSHPTGTVIVNTRPTPDPPVAEPSEEELGPTRINVRKVDEPTRRKPKPKPDAAAEPEG